MSRPEGNSRPAQPGNDPASPAHDPALDPDATRIAPAGVPLERMPPITAANRRARGGEDFQETAFPDTHSMRAPLAGGAAPIASADDLDADRTVLAPAALLTPRDTSAAAAGRPAAPGTAPSGSTSGAAAAHPSVGTAAESSSSPDLAGRPPSASHAAAPGAAAGATAGTPPAAAAGASADTAPMPEKRPSTGTLPGGALAASAAAASADMPVRQVGRYQILERIGRGGMASVFKAHDPGIGRDVAIKFLHASLCEDEEYRARFLREARASGGLSHPNIVTVHDVGEIDGRPYMAMELLDGLPLADLLEPGKPLPVRDVVVMAIQLARALDYAHKRGIVHRDIKPGNIARMKGTSDIKVMDFGIAHMESTKGEQRTRVGDVLGTPQYMSPEQMNGEKIDGRSDLFSVGIVLYQMLTGQRPFSGDSVVSLALKIAKEDPTPLNKLRPGLPASLRRVVDRCLAKAPEHRFQSGGEVAEALVKVLAEIDEEARNKSGPRIIPLRVKWAAMMAGIVAVVMAVTCSIILQRQNEALMQQVADYGSALSRFIAAQNATSALAEDWVSVDVSLQEIMKTRDFANVTVTDRAGMVTASSQAESVGQAYQAPPGEVLGEQGEVKRTRYHVGGEAVLGFESPIMFQGKQVGRVALGLPERPLESVARLSRTLMAVLAVVTVLAVAIAMFFVANWFSRPIKLVVEALGEVARGRVDYRIREQRKDEFGLLYSAFDQMAQALQDRQALAASALKAEAPLTQVPRMPGGALPTAVAGGAGAAAVSGTAGSNASGASAKAPGAPEAPAAAPVAGTPTATGPELTTDIDLSEPASPPKPPSAG